MEMGEQYLGAAGLRCLLLGSLPSAVIHDGYIMTKIVPKLCVVAYGNVFKYLKY